jgi:xylulokinase
MSHVIGVDVSTTSTKALLMRSDGQVVGVASSPYDYDVPHANWTEQSPHLWWEAATSAISKVLADNRIDGRDVDAVGLSGQMHGSVLLDRAGDVVRPAILWNDQRTAAQCDEIRRRVGRRRLIDVTGNDALTGFTAPKLLWVAEHEPDNWARVASVLLPKDYVRFLLTGDRAVDVADGSGTILFDLAGRTWSSEIIEAMDLDPAILPPVFEGPDVTGVVNGDAAAVTGLVAGTPVVAGGGDQSAGGIGVGAVSDGSMALSLGTSGVVFAATDLPLIDPEARVHSFCHAVPGRWHVMGVMLSAAGSLRWLRDAVAPASSFEELVDGAAEVAPGAGGLLFLPYLTGERTPYPDPHARGAFVGLSVDHDLRHMTRAVLEGVAFGLRDGLDLMVSAGVPAPDAITGSGGGTRSDLWCRILADVLQVEISTVITEEGPALGAAMLAGTASGHFPSIEAVVESVVKVAPRTGPSPDVPVYQEAHGRYRELYPALRSSFAAAATVGSVTG